MTITARELNRSTLARQLLLQRETLAVGDAVRRVVALQAQQAASPYLALWNRLTGFDAADLDTAFAGHEVVKSTLMRITLHAVHIDDFRAFHEAVQPSLRAARLGDRFTVSGLTPRTPTPWFGAAGVRRPAAHGFGVRGLAHTAAGRTAEARRVVGATAVHAAAARTHHATVVVRHPSVVRRAPEPARTGRPGGLRRVPPDAGPALSRGVRAGIGGGRGTVRAGPAGESQDGLAGSRR